jgi:hypothetical protein
VHLPRRSRATRHRILEGRAESHRLVDGWCRTIAIGWIGIAIALASVGASSQMIGRPAWWADDQRWNTVVVTALVMVVFVAITFVAVWAFFRGPFIPEISATGGVLLAVCAFVDRHASPGAAIVTAVLAASAVLLAVAGLSGRQTSPRAIDQTASRVLSSSSIAD